MEETVFDKIIKREIPAHIVHEDEHTLAFLDLNPVQKGHTLVIPKHKCTNIFDCPPETVGYVYQTAQRIAKHMLTALRADGVNVFGNNDPAAGQEVPYFHVHVIPRFEGKHPFKTPAHEVYDADEMVEYTNKLRLS